MLFQSLHKRYSSTEPELTSALPDPFALEFNSVFNQGPGQAVEVGERKQYVLFP